MSDQEAKLSPVVQIALRQYIGEDTLVPCRGGLRQKDRPIVAGLLYCLLKNRETFSWEHVRTWALEIGSSTEFADELGDLADEVLAGDWDARRWKFRDDALAQWRAEAAANPGAGLRPSPVRPGPVMEPAAPLPPGVPVRRGRPIRGN